MSIIIKLLAAIIAFTAITAEAAVEMQDEEIFVLRAGMEMPNPATVVAWAFPPPAPVPDLPLPGEAPKP